jgi:hypothetical protein
MGHCGGSNNDTPDEEAMKLAAEVVIWVGTHDPVMARKVRDLGAHVMRMAKHIDALTDSLDSVCEYCQDRCHCLRTAPSEATE